MDGPDYLCRGSLSCIYSFKANDTYVLPPYRITGQLRILRQTLIFNFGQENIRIMI
jgi:hypothetical protein